jgi:hypothetical protein
MKSLEINRKSTAKRVLAALAFAGAALGAAACGNLAMMMGNGAQRPAEGAFGTGPRVSEKHAYIARLQPEQPLRVRQLQRVPVLVTDARGRPVDDATITVDGGMPEHGHGLPTQPRVVHAAGAGMYEIEGLRFSMGGWWELKLAIDSAAGADSVTFNLSL